MREKRQPSCDYVPPRTKETLTVACWSGDVLPAFFTRAAVSSPKEQLWLRVFGMNAIFCFSHD